MEGDVEGDGVTMMMVLIMDTLKVVSVAVMVVNAVTGPDEHYVSMIYWNCSHLQ